MKVRVNAQYLYYPNLMDRCMGCKMRIQLTPGDTVRVVNLHGCPPANTMGQCYVELNGEFAGMVSTNSLYSFKDRQLVVDAIKLDLETLAEDIDTQGRR